MGEMAETEGGTKLETRIINGRWMESDVSEAEYMAELEAGGDLRIKKDRVDEVQKTVESVLRALEDGSYWVTTKGGRRPVNLLTKSHAENIVAWLERRATFLHDYVCLQMATGPQPRGDAASAAFDLEFNMLNEKDPKEWLAEQPLVRNLKVRAQRKLVKFSQA